MNRYITLLFILLLFCSGCELYTQDDYEEYIVIESYLVANGTLPQVLLSHTTPIEGEYKFQDTAIEGAEVQIRRLNADSSIIETYSYEQVNSGIYEPVSSHVVLDEQLYELYIQTNSGETVKAQTFVPGNFETVNRDQLAEEYVYQSGEQVQLKVTPSEYPGRQTFYFFTVNISSDSDLKLTPFYADLVEEQDADTANFYINSSNIVNEGNYNQNEDGTITLNLPWISIAFYGENTIIANAIDDNMYDFLRSQSVQTGGSTLSPGEIQNIDYNVEGGIGIFGSMASDTNAIKILEPKQ